MAGTQVRFPSNGQEAEGYLAKPASGRGPGVIVIQEWWGLNDNIMDICDRLAKEGFIALAPDLYHGAKTSEPDEAGKLMMAMKFDQAAKDMSGAADYLAGLDAATGDRMGVTGFCMGGGLALVLATLRPKIAACVPFYGVLPAQPDFPKMQAAVLGHYAENDQWASPASTRELEAKLKSLGKQVEFYTYPGTEHGFFNDTRSEVHNVEAAKLAWERTLGWFDRYLRKRA
jgi:carboxymethylenebutenolidase